MDSATLAARWLPPAGRTAPLATHSRGKLLDLYWRIRREIDGRSDCVSVLLKDSIRKELEHHKLHPSDLDLSLLPRTPAIVVDLVFPFKRLPDDVTYNRGRDLLRNCKMSLLAPTRYPRDGEYRYPAGSYPDVDVLGGLLRLPRLPGLTRLQLAGVVLGSATLAAVPSLRGLLLTDCYLVVGPAFVDLLGRLETLSLVGCTVLGWEIPGIPVASPAAPLNAEDANACIERAQKAARRALGTPRPATVDARLRWARLVGNSYLNGDTRRLLETAAFAATDYLEVSEDGFYPPHQQRAALLAVLSPDKCTIPRPRFGFGSLGFSVPPGAFVLFSTAAGTAPVRGLANLCRHLLAAGVAARVVRLARSPPPQTVASIREHGVTLEPEVRQLADGLVGQLFAEVAILHGPPLATWMPVAKTG